MFKKAIHFIKYNNAAVLILVVIFIMGSGVWAQTEAGQEFIGEQQISNEGVDNILLLEADLDNFDMEFRIEQVEGDDNYFYVTYTYMDLALIDDAWQYQIQEAIRKVSKSLKKDLGIYLAEELQEEYEQRIKELSAEQSQASELGVESTRVEVSEYSGLIGTTLDLAGRFFNDYEPIKIREIPSPSIPPSVLASSVDESAVADDLTDIYNEYINANDPDRDDVFGVLDNCPDDFNPGQEDKDGDDIGDVCDPYYTLIPEEEDVSTTTNETATSSEDSLENSEQKTENSTATSSETQADGEPDVEVIELPVENATSTE
ncbi:hypothetical protein KAJ89_02655 [Candidatus Parcubacteria bacterium]|nr:hypothetical protein [Candidatus Parcubacteria bacterium]